MIASCSLMKPTAQSKTAAKMAFARPSRVYAALCASRGTCEPWARAAGGWCGRSCVGGSRGRWR
eukprot:1990338-Prymnesium_polylepis.1